MSTAPTTELIWLGCNVVGMWWAQEEYLASSLGMPLKLVMLA